MERGNSTKCLLKEKQKSNEMNHAIPKTKIEALEAELKKEQNNYEMKDVRNLKLRSNTEMLRELRIRRKLIKM